MKRLAYIFLAFFATAALFSCTEESTYEPGPQASGAQYYFSSDEATSVTISHTTQSVSVNLFRVETGSASTATVSIADESGLISSASSATANFAAGSNKATLTFPITPSDWEFAKDYKVTYTVFDETTPYGKSELAVTYKYPTPLTLLGNGKVTESYFTGGEWTPKVYRSDIDPNEYHIQKFMGSKSEDLILHVTKAGDTFEYEPGKTRTFNTAGLVWFPDTYIGLTYADIGGEGDYKIYLCHPANGFSKTATEEFWMNCRVVLFQDNGIPAIVEIAPWYYMFELGGWNKTSAPTVTIIFPGYEPKDYAVEAAYEGIFKNPDDEVFAEASVFLGEDIESGVAVVVAGDSDEAIAAGIEKLGTEDESVVTFNGSTVRVPMPADAATGTYTIIVGGVAEGAVQEVAVASFFYQAGNVALDWSWLAGSWKASDYSYAQDGSTTPYEMTITKVDETHCKVANLMNKKIELEGVVDFDAQTITFAGNQFAFKDDKIAGDCYFIAVDPANEYDCFDDLTTPVVATFTASGITIDNYDFFIVGGQYNEYTYYGGIRTTMTPNM